MKVYAIGLLLLVAFVGHSQCNCFLIKEANTGIEIEKTIIENNRVEVINDPNVISVVFTLGEGMNGDMIQASKRKGMIIAQCVNNTLKLKIRNADGTEKPLPDINTEDSKDLDIRVNVIGGNGERKAFLIQHYETIIHDKGPVLDMFGGKLPVANGDYLITTESKKKVDTKN
jgi:hypothetical protein